LVKKIAELNKKMGSQFAALVDIEKHVDSSPDGQDIASIVASLGESCGSEGPRSDQASPTKCGKNIVVAYWATSYV